MEFVARGFLFSACLFVNTSLKADHHVWQFGSIFSNANGSVQYIEMTSADDGQRQLQNRTLVSFSAGETQQFVFDQDLTSDTASTSLLLATANFYALTGLKPDYIIPDRFISLSGGRLEFADGVDSMTYIKEALPLNGVQALKKSGEVILSQPTSFSGVSVTVSANSWGIYDANAGELTLPMIEASDSRLANASFTVDLAAIEFTLLDTFYFYQAGIIDGNTPARLNQDGTVYVPALLADNTLFEIELTVVSENPIVLGNPMILSVTTLPANRNGEIQTESAIENSIARGEDFYTQQCANCHGSNGAGGIAAAIIFSANNIGFEELRRLVNDKMPFQNPSLCKDSETETCATDVTNYTLSAIQQLRDSQ